MRLSIWPERAESWRKSSTEARLSWLLVSLTDVNLSTIQSILRHSKPSTTAVLYTHRVNAAQMAAQAKFLDAIKVTSAVAEADFLDLGFNLGLGEEDMSTGWSTKSLKRIGGPDRDRTDDLFHAMEASIALIIENKWLMRRNNRPNRHSRRGLAPN